MPEAPVSLWMITRSPWLSGASPPLIVSRPRMPATLVTPWAWKANGAGSTVTVGGCTSFVSCTTVPTS